MLHRLINFRFLPKSKIKCQLCWWYLHCCRCTTWRTSPCPGSGGATATSSPWTQRPSSPTPDLLPLSGADNYKLWGCSCSMWYALILNPSINRHGVMCCNVCRKLYTNIFSKTFFKSFVQFRWRLDGLWTAPGISGWQGGCSNLDNNSGKWHKLWQSQQSNQEQSTGTMKC